MKPHYTPAAARMRQRKLEQAIELLKTNPKFPAAQVQAHDRATELAKNLSPQQSAFGTPERMDLALETLKVQAEAYLTLVEGMASQEAFMTCLEEFGRQAFENFTGFPLEAVVSTRGPELQMIQQRVSHWVNEGYRRLVPADHESTPHAARPGAPEEEEARRERLLTEYKAATGNATNRQIYTARNSGIHKPEFYHWRNGSLPADSDTTKNFERFLREKRAPIPRRPKT